MKKRAKQLAMLGLTVTMMCGTQMTAFASGLGEEAPVAIETEAKATANEETEEVKVEAKEEKADAKEEVKTEVKEEVVTGTEVAETPVVEETEVKETVAGTEELVGLGVSTEAEAETEAPAEKEDAVEDAVPTPAPQTEVEVEEPATEAGNSDVAVKVDEPKLSITANSTTFDGTQDIIITFHTDYEGTFTWLQDTLDINGNPVGSSWEPVSDNEWRVTVNKDHILSNLKKHNYSNGQVFFLGTDGWGVEYDGNGDGTLESVAFPNISFTYSTGDTGNGGGTVTPEPEKPQPEPENPQPEPEKPQPEPEKPQPDGGNGGTETPDPEKDGWIKTDEGWTYYENGQKVTGWKAVSEKWYYFNENGIMETGWASVGGHWYYLNADGSMATGWVSVGGHWYYLNTDGTMVTGWASVGGHWYYLNTDGSMASSQWIDGWYVDASGKML